MAVVLQPCQHRASCNAIVPATDPRQRLLGPNAGQWLGTFIRCGADGLERERFPTSLQVSDQAGTIEAALTYCNTGEVRSMRFAQPPAEMQIAEAGHWSLGPERIGPWPWFAELCVVHGDRRRRVVLRHGSELLESCVLVVEARPGVEDPPPPAPLQARRLGEGHWQLGADVELRTAMRRQLGDPVACVLRWCPEPGLVLELERRYGASGLLEPLA
jgi:hypothetical protein